MTDHLVNIDPSDNDLKEKLISQYYFGGVNCCPKDFINRNMDLHLINQINNDPNMTWDGAKSMVLNYIANYCCWVSMTNKHYQETEFLVIFHKFYNIILLQQKYNKTYE